MHLKVSNDLATWVMGGGKLQFVERKEGHLASHLLLVHYGQYLRGSLIVVHNHMKQPEPRNREKGKGEWGRKGRVGEEEERDE